MTMPVCPGYAGHRFPTSDVVGRHLMHHALVAAEIWVDQPINSHIGNSGAIISSQFAEIDAWRPSGMARNMLLNLR